jgi:protein-L-isoaspartate(D-aspartate) O-methyltransferase
LNSGTIGPFAPVVLSTFEVKPSDSIPQDYLRAREKMVEEQIVARGIKNPRLLAAMRKVPRHLFVDSGLLQRAYADSSLPIGQKQTLSQPYMAARMTEALELLGEERVLEIGTGSGYQTALLAELSFNVFSVEKIRALATRARGLLDRLQYHNIAIQVGDGSIGWPEHSPFDAVIVTAAAPELPRPLLEQLAPGGRLVIPVGDEEAQVLIRVTRHDSKLKEEQLGDCRFVKLWGKFGWQE